MDDKPEGMPEFGEPGELPPAQQAPAVKQKKEHCQAITKNGNRCGFYPQHGGKKFCCVHDPDIPAEQKRAWRQHNGSKTAGIARASSRPKSKKDLIAILSLRLDRFILRFGSDSNVQVEETVCHIVRTIAYVMSVEAEEVGGIKGWRMPKTGS